MGLTAETNRVVQEFDVNDADLNKGVTEFLSQMGASTPVLTFPLIDRQLMPLQTRASTGTAPA